MSFVDKGISGRKESRPAMDKLIASASSPLSAKHLGRGARPAANLWEPTTPVQNDQHDLLARTARVSLFLSMLVYRPIDGNPQMWILDEFELDAQVGVGIEPTNKGFADLERRWRRTVGRGLFRPGHRRWRSVRSASPILIGRWTHLEHQLPAVGYLGVG